MKNKLKLIFILSEINLLAWIIILLNIFESKTDNQELIKYSIYVGFTVSLVLQHWIYYKLYKPEKIKEKQAITSGSTE